MKEHYSNNCPNTARRGSTDLWVHPHNPSFKLESRPIPDRDFEFMFYFDLESSVYSPKLAQLLAELERECDEFTYLGSYSEVV